MLATMGEEERWVRVMGETLAMKRLRERESVLLERGRVEDESKVYRESL